MRTLAGLLLLVVLAAGRAESMDTAKGPVDTAAATTAIAPVDTVTPTPNPTATPTPAPVQMIATYYDVGFEGGPLYCGTDIYGRYDPADPTTVAAGAAGPPCGTHLRVCNETTCIGVIVKDRCGGCGAAHLDLSRGAWEALGQPSEVSVYE